MSGLSSRRYIRFFSHLLIFSIYFRFTNVTLETLGLYHWGLWLHNICVCDLRYVYHVLSETQYPTPKMNWRWIIYSRTYWLPKEISLFIFVWSFMKLSTTKAFLPKEIQLIFFEISDFSIVTKTIKPTYLFYRPHRSHRYFFQRSVLCWNSKFGWR